jgi:hypothetical protein
LENPLKYRDSTGHVAVCGLECDDPYAGFKNQSFDEYLKEYGVELGGAAELWDVIEKAAIVLAVKEMGDKLQQYIGGTAASAFAAVFESDENNPFANRMQQLRHVHSEHVHDLEIRQPMAARQENRGARVVPRGESSPGERPCPGSPQLRAAPSSSRR